MHKFILFAINALNFIEKYGTLNLDNIMCVVNKVRKLK